MLYFAYGSNLELDRMANRCPNATPLQRATLHDWKLEFCFHANIVRHAGGTVEGAIFDINPRDERALDRYEGWPTYYRKEYVRMPGVDGRKNPAVLVYVMNEERARHEPPADSYLQIIMDGYAQWAIPLDTLHNAVHEADHRSAVALAQRGRATRKDVQAEALRILRKRSQRRA